MFIFEKSKNNKKNFNTKNQMKIFLTGASGFIGQYILRELSRNHAVLAQYFRGNLQASNHKTVKLDLRNVGKTREIIENFLPEIIIHAAAISKPAEAEQLGYSETAKINVEATKTLARIANELNAKIIFFSTDLVYDGNGKPFKKETEKTEPISVYAKTKLDAEKEIRENSDNYLILRIALHFGIGLNGAKNHFSEIFEKLAEKKPVKLFYDQYRTPLEATQSAKIILQLLETNVKNEIINFGGKERVSRFELGEILAEICGFDKNLLQKISLDEINSGNKVKDVSMNTDKLASIGVKRISVEASIYEICKKARLAGRALK